MSVLERHKLLPKIAMSVEGIFEELGPKPLTVFSREPYLYRLGSEKKTL